LSGLVRHYLRVDGSPFRRFCSLAGASGPIDAARSSVVSDSVDPGLVRVCAGFAVASIKFSAHFQHTNNSGQKEASENGLKAVENGAPNWT
jgi:hypothetical protein